MNIKELEIVEFSNWLSQFGMSDFSGITRRLYDPVWSKAQHSLYDTFVSNGFEAGFDAIGNLSGRIQGTDFPEETIASGSHIDTVVNGGNLDGQFGIVAAYLAIKYLRDTYGAPKRTLEVLSLAEEEGSRFPYVFWGSKNVFGCADSAAVSDLKDAQGIGFEQAMRDAGFDYNTDNTARRDIKAFIELHIEQGNVLEVEHKGLGVVTDIVGQKRFNVALNGTANHAGTTPMGYRKDTIYAFSRICSELTEKAKAQGDPLVITFGHVDVIPNTSNVIPGNTRFSIDCRHTDQKSLNQFEDEIYQTIRKICAELDIGHEIERWMNEAPVAMNKKLVELSADVCELKGYNYKVMHSGAGHDAQIFAVHVPTVMMFIPSIAGVSHNPEEKSKTEDLVLGVNALAQVLYELAYS